MKFLTAKEAGELVGVSAIRLTQLIRPDSHEPTPTGAGRRYLYSPTSVKRFIRQREKEAKAKREKFIKRELKGVTRPGPEYMTPTEAAHFSGFSKTTIANNCPIKYVHGKKFYSQRDIQRIPAGATPRAKGNAGKKSAAICECGRTFMRNAATTKCIVCLQGFDPNDPYGTIMPRKKGTRKCPICGQTLFIGQYTCGKNSCKIEVVEDAGAIDALMVYGGRG